MSGANAGSSSSAKGQQQQRVASAPQRSSHGGSGTGGSRRPSMTAIIEEDDELETATTSSVVPPASRSPSNKVSTPSRAPQQASSAPVAKTPPAASSASPSVKTTPKSPVTDATSTDASGGSSSSNAPPALRPIPVVRYYDMGGGLKVFDNPLYTGETAASTVRRLLGSTMGLKDFLASIPSFSDFSEKQLDTMERKARIVKFKEGEVVFKQGEPGNQFFVIHSGSVEILIQDDPVLIVLNELGRVVNRLTPGYFFGERALMTSEPRAATVRCLEATVCVAFDRATFEDVISGTNALLGSDINDTTDWSKDGETRSLYKHIEKVKQIDKMELSPRIRKITYELTTAFTPELSVDEIVARMVLTVKSAVKGDRVGLFVLTEDRSTMVLKVSERSKGIRIPVRGLAGAVITSGESMNIADAYMDNRFDSTLDRRTKYRTRQVLGVPLRHPFTHETMGVLQVNNRTDGSLERFSDEHQSILELAAEQLSELLHGRAELLMKSGGGGRTAQHRPSQSSLSATGLGTFEAPIQRPASTIVLSSCELASHFEIELRHLSLLFNLAPGEVPYKHIKIVASLHFALNELCPAQSMIVALPPGNPRLSTGRGDKGTAASAPAKREEVEINDRLQFAIHLRNLPRAARIMFKVSGSRKGAAGPFTHIGWAATAVFDFKGCIQAEVKMNLFPDDVSCPINTTLSNVHDKACTSLSVVLAADFTLSDVAGLRKSASAIAETSPSKGSAAAVTSSSSRDSQLLSNAPTGPREVLDSSKLMIVHSMPTRSAPMLSAPHLFKDAELEELNRILQLSYNPMSNQLMRPDDRRFLWDLRYSILDRPDLLPAVVMSVQWEDSEQVEELYELLDLWDQPSHAQALLLLDRRFMDPKVRAFAVHCLEDLPDEVLALYMLQLCQQLKFENHIDSALARFLLRRALANMRLIGHIFFWQLKSEVYNLDVRVRFVALLLIYLQHSDHHRVELGHQMFVMRRLESVAERVQAQDGKADRLTTLRRLLTEINLPNNFQLPLNPHITVRGIIVDRCKVMESKKKPLWLTLRNADPQGPDIVLMLKVGDDLRQDSLILQLLRVMEDLWRREGLEMRMMIYDCISTGFERGLLQVVQNATTLGSIILESTLGKLSVSDAQPTAADSSADASTPDRKAVPRKAATSQSGTLSLKLRSAVKALGGHGVLREWLMHQVGTEIPASDAAARIGEMESRVKNFIISTAAYCVASYVLGLGDRHNDNLMMTKTGHFFHIDFGHILGNMKYKMGVKRERAPFVFTPAMRAVMSEEEYEAFQVLCCDIYNILREHSMLLVSLCSLAIPCNLPELRQEKDVLWIYDKLMIGATNEEASAKFRELTATSLSTKGTLLNDAAHMLRHA